MDHLHQHISSYSLHMCGLILYAWKKPTCLETFCDVLLMYSQYSKSSFTSTAPSKEGTQQQQDCLKNKQSWGLAVSHRLLKAVPHTLYSHTLILNHKTAIAKQNFNRSIHHFCQTLLWLVCTHKNPMRCCDFTPALLVPLPYQLLMTWIRRWNIPKADA